MHWKLNHDVVVGEVEVLEIARDSTSTTSGADEPATAAGTCIGIVRH
jgi:hypothetical protein